MKSMSKAYAAAILSLVEGNYNNQKSFPFRRSDAEISFPKPPSHFCNSSRSAAHNPSVAFSHKTTSCQAGVALTLSSVHCGVSSVQALRSRHLLPGEGPTLRRSCMDQRSSV